jgi:hypothetical protein
MVAILRRCVTELVHLFVDDDVHTALMVGWIVVACLVFRYVSLGVWSGPLLFAGLAAIFVATTVAAPTPKG